MANQRSSSQEANEYDELVNWIYFFKVLTQSAIFVDFCKPFNLSKKYFEMDCYFFSFIREKNVTRSLKKPFREKSKVKKQKFDFESVLFE